MQPKKFINPNGVTYEMLSFATNSETGKASVIYRKATGDKQLLVCSKEWWEEQNFVLPEAYAQDKITRYSPSEVKIKLFLSLFIGRTDVYAKRWESSAGKSGYSPVCLNEWDPAVCLKPSGKCADCEHKNYAAFDYDVVQNHLMGKITVGIYPMLADETCRFLAMDFDGAEWKQDILAVYDLCKSKAIPAYMERSRSGQGGHLWIFFSEALPASQARKLGSCLLTAAMNLRHEIKFSSYDRLFPNQDTMPKGCFGNLIALPLQKVPRKEGNTEFIDEDFQVYPDQWAFMAAIRSVSRSEVASFIEMLGGSDVGDLYENTEENLEKPWEPKKPVTLSKNDFPPKVHVVSSNMLYIEKTGISSKGIAYLKRLASFKNPDFYKAQAMRLSTYNKPHIISCAEETDRYLCLPRGLFDTIKHIFTNYGVHTKATDKTNPGRQIKVAFRGVLRPEQEAAKNALLSGNCGTLSASTAFGKTVVGAGLIAERKVNTLILVHRTNLLKQWIEWLKEFLIIDEEPPIEYTPKGRKRRKDVIGQIGGTKNNLSGIIDVAVMQSLISAGEVKEIVRNYGMVIVDECHHVSAFSFEQVLKTANARYVYGLTATPVRQDGHHPIIYMQCGAIAYKADNKTALENHSFEHYMIPKFTSFYSNHEKIQEIYSDLVKDEVRNSKIIHDCIDVVEAGRTPLILTERTAHVEILAEQLKNYNVIKLVGGKGNKYNTEIAAALNSISNHEKLILIATGKYAGEGFDFPRLDTLLLTMPISWKGTLQQYAGRLHREYKGKNEVRIYDYIDAQVPMLEKMYQKRLKGYNSIGYQIKSPNLEGNHLGSIYDVTNFSDIFAEDMLASHSEIVIASPLVSKRAIQQWLPAIEPVMGKLTVITKPETAYKYEDTARRAKMCINLLKSYGVNVKVCSNLHQKFAVMDRRLIWYGSINLLGNNTADETVMRLENTDIAMELLQNADKFC